MSRRRIPKEQIDPSLSQIKLDIERKRKLRKKRRRKIILRRVTLLFSLLGIIVAFVLFDRSSISRVREVSVQGNHYITQEEILEKAKVEVGDRLLFTHSFILNNRTSHIQGVANTDVKVYYTKGLVTLIVEESPVVGYQQNESGMLLLFADNYQKQVNELKQINFPLLIGFNDDLLSNNPKFSSRLAKIEKTAFNSISEIHVETNDLESLYLKFVMNNGFYVYTSVDNLMLLDNYAEIVSGVLNGDKPNNRCIYFTDYGNTPDTQIAVSKPCE